MERLSLTPFGSQPVTAGLLATQSLMQQEAPLPEVDKWELLRDLTVGRDRFQVTDRDLAVLSALLSFLPGAALEDDAPLIVFPSNRALSQRAHGMAESTLRRHLAALVRAGLVARQDSPNGKRYARKGMDGEVHAAFGFDLRPLLVQAQAIFEAAGAARAAELAYKAARERCVLAMRDAAKLIVYGREDQPDAGNWDAWEDELRLAQRMLRRKLSMQEIEELERKAEALRGAIVAALDSGESEEMDGNDVINERHYHNSKPQDSESEPCLESEGTEGQGGRPKIPLALVRKACPELEIFGGEPMKAWPDLIASAEKVRPMVGISLDAWREACALMGPCDAAISIGFILERMEEIKSPGGYLRALARKAGQGGLSTGPMVMSLLNRSERKVA